MSSGADVTITNSGTISATDYQAIRANGMDTDGLTINNSGTITSASNAIYLYQSEGATVTNSGTIRVTNGHDAIWTAYTDDITITNSGTLKSDTGYAMSSIGYSGGENLTLTNTGTIQGNSYDLHVSSDTGIGTLSNDQGGGDALKLYGYLPVVYNIIVNSTSDFGKLAVSGQNGSMTFGIHTSSALSATTYSDVITGVSSSRISSGTTGTVSASNGVFTWSLNNTSGDDWDLVITADTTAPTLSSSSPADNATSVAVNSNIVLNFSEAVDVESGNITIKKASDNSTVETISITGSKVTGTGGTAITINPGTNFDQKTEYYVLVDSTAFDDPSSNSYTGISSTTALSFTTIDSTIPSLSSSSPADDGTDIEIDINIVLTFSEAVDVESGNITLKKTSDNSTIETINVTSSNVTGTGSTQITINPSNNLEFATEYYLLIDASAFDDSASNSYAGISSTTALSFKSVDGDPFTEPVVIAINEQQSTQAKKIMEESVKSVIDRIDLIRQIDSNISSQGIQLAFNLNDQFAKEIFTLASKEYLLKNTDVEEKKWAIWTEGNISYGSVGETSTSVGQKIHSDGITIGIDKKLQNENIIGFSLSTVWQETEVGGNQAVVDTNAYNFMTYGGIKISNQSYLDVLLGAGEMDIDIVRQITGGENTGNRDGRQIYGSVAYSMEPNQKWKDSIKINDPSSYVNIYSRLDLGITILNEYTENGVASKTLHYNNQHIKNGSISVGTIINKNRKIKNGIIAPFLRFEGGINKANNSITEVYYNARPTQIFTNAINDDLITNTRLGLGVRLNLDNNWNYNIIYDRVDNSNHSFTNNLYINIRKNF